MQSLLSLLRTRLGRQTNGAGARCRRSRHHPLLDRLEERILLATADGNGPVVTGLYEEMNQGTAKLVVDFDGPLNVRLASNVADYMMPSQLPGPPDLLGAEAAFFTSPDIPQFANGVIRLAKLHGPTTLGYLFGGIQSMVAETEDQATQTSASNMMFRVTLIPN